jgi:hypothetical protein
VAIRQLWSSVRAVSFAITPAAREWQDRLDEIAPGRFMVMMQVMAVGAVLQASPLIGGDDDQVAVTIEPATGDQLIGCCSRRTV